MQIFFSAEERMLQNGSIFKYTTQVSELALLA